MSSAEAASYRVSCPLWLGSPKRGGTYLFRSRSNLGYAVKSGRARSVGSRFRACTEGRGRSERLLSERFGPFTFGLALVVDREKLFLVVRRWSVFRLPPPVALAPGGTSYEYVAKDRFCFHVEIKHVLTGLIVRYRGWLVPSVRGHIEPGVAEAPSSSYESATAPSSCVAW